MNNLKIFISYRRADEPLYAHLIKSSLDQCSLFNPDHIFLDVRDSGIQIGEYFDDAIQASIKDCDVLIIVMGRKWAHIMQDRLDEEIDWVRVEISNALKYKKFIIPVLANHDNMPDSSLLPASIKDICRINAAKLRVNDLESDLKKIVETIQNKFEQTSSLSSPQQLNYNRKPLSKLDWSLGCIVVNNPKGFQREEEMQRFLTKHIGYPCSCQDPEDTQRCPRDWHTWRVKNENNRRLRSAVAFCGRDNLCQSGNFKLNLTNEGSDEMIITAKDLGYRVVPCPDYMSKRVIISPPQEPSDKQLEHMAYWAQLAQILPTIR